jgi:hypothetical protein
VRRRMVIWVDRNLAVCEPFYCRHLIAVGNHCLSVKDRNSVSGRIVYDISRRC